MEHRVHLETICCPVCLDLLEDPGTLPCGHSYCMDCIRTHWDRQDQDQVYSCPLCRKTFRPRPEMVKSTVLAAVVEQLKKTRPPRPAAARSQRQRELDLSRIQIQQRIQDRQKDVELLQQELEAINRSADQALEDCESTFTELIRILVDRRSELKQQVRSQQETEGGRVREEQEKLQQEIRELQRRHAELDQDQAPHSPPSLPAPSQSTSSTQTRSLSYFQDLTAAVSRVRDTVQDVLRDLWTDISLAEPDVLLISSRSEPKTRSAFLKHSCQISLDPDTAQVQLLLSDGNRKVTLTKRKQSYPDHPDRFSVFRQVLGREGLTGHCYWELDWSGAVSVAVSYKTISRDGSDASRFGFNDRSWVLDCDRHGCSFLHNRVQTPVCGPPSSRLGVYLDHSAGVLSFYSVSETMTLLHRVQTRFTELLYAGVCLYYDSHGVSAKFCKLE